MQGTSNWNIRLSCINSFETRRIIINGPIARKLESRDATRSRITEPMFTTLESYSVVDSIASRLRVTVSPRIISRNLDLRDIETLPLNLDLYHLNPRWTTSRVTHQEFRRLVFLLSKIRFLTNLLDFQSNPQFSSYNSCSNAAFFENIEHSPLYIFQIVFSFTILII